MMHMKQVLLVFILLVGNVAVPSAFAQEEPIHGQIEGIDRTKRVILTINGSQYFIARNLSIQYGGEVKTSSALQVGDSVIFTTKNNKSHNKKSVVTSLSVVMD